MSKSKKKIEGRYMMRFIGWSIGSLLSSLIFNTDTMGIFLGGIIMLTICYWDYM